MSEDALLTEAKTLATLLLIAALLASAWAVFAFVQAHLLIQTLLFLLWMGLILVVLLFLWRSEDGWGSGVVKGVRTKRFTKG